MRNVLLLALFVTICPPICPRHSRSLLAAEDRVDPVDSAELMIVTEDAPYFQKGSKRGAAPAGTFKSDTPVRVLRRVRDFAFVFVEDQQGRQGWVQASSLKPDPSASVERDDDSVLSLSNHRFAVALYRELARTQTGNFFYSPASIESVLGVMRAGAVGETRLAITRAMQLESKEDVAGFDHAADIRWQILNQASRNFEVVCSNHLWGSRDVAFRTEFRDRLFDERRAELTMVNFGDPEGVRLTIDNWVRDKTKGKIPGILDRPLDPRTSLVITNATYFKASWAKEFSPHLTDDWSFQPLTGHAQTVKLMTGMIPARFLETPNLQIIELPYAGQEFSAVILLPRWNPDEGTAQLAEKMAVFEQELTPERLRKSIDRLVATDVKVSLPRILLTKSIDLRELLTKLGMGPAFDPNANFTAMVEQPVLLNDVLHRSLLEVNEGGTTAAAVTQAVLGAGSGPTVIVDHPFVLLIRDVRRGFILFMGRITNP